MTTTTEYHADDRVLRAYLLGFSGANVFLETFGRPDDEDALPTAMLEALADPRSPCSDLDRARLYYEAHITVLPPSTESQYREKGGDWDQFAATSRELGWRASRFSEDEVDNADGMWFLSHRSESYRAILGELVGMVHGLGSSDFEVVRYKIEDTLLDSKHGDTL